MWDKAVLSATERALYMKQFVQTLVCVALGGMMELICKSVTLSEHLIIMDARITSQ